MGREGEGKELGGSLVGVGVGGDGADMAIMAALLICRLAWTCFKREGLHCEYQPFWMCGYQERSEGT